MRIREVMIGRYLSPDVVKQLNKGVPSSECLKENALDKVVLMECEKEAVLFFIHAADSFIVH